MGMGPSQVNDGIVWVHSQMREARKDWSLRRFELSWIHGKDNRLQTAPHEQGKDSKLQTAPHEQKGRQMPLKTCPGVGFEGQSSSPETPDDLL